MKAEANQLCPSHSALSSARLMNRIGNGLSILLVDDNQNTAEGTAILLRAYGHHVQVVPDGPAACQVALHKPLDSVLLLDLEMPDMDGCEVARRLQEPSWEKKAFFIGLTDDTAKKLVIVHRTPGLTSTC